ncbi:MAG TPA: DUF421 domain-containing protein, partial [Anaerolineae bacterium]|nr:DUF421 domain-containing protein [Anaerolineae bacterium]
MENFFDWLLGLNEETLTVWQVAVRGLLVYSSSLLLGRVAGKRFFGEHTAFDVVLGIILGSVMSRAINGSAPFWGTVIGGLTLVLLH